MQRSCIALLFVLAASCAEPAPALMTPHAARDGASPSLVEVARAEPPPGYRVVLAAYPTTACSASARMVFMDRDGTFLGALAPGEAALLTLPSHLKSLVAVSSVEITAPTRMSVVLDEIKVPAAPDAILLHAWRANARQCSRTGQYASASIVSKREIEERLAASEILWVEPRAREGQAWLDAHRARVDELLASR
jgi:hypothetical protein